MRCLPIRSVLRAAITSGLIASCQHATVQASWKDYLPASVGTCYVHDLNWDRFQTRLNAVESIVKPVDLEAEMCLAAAKQFELKMQVDAIFESIKSNSRFASQFATKVIVGFAQSRRLLVETIRNHEWKVVEIPESIDPIQVASLSADQVLDFGYDWNCGEWCRDRKLSEMASLPSRDVANIFVYSLDENPDEIPSTESIETAFDYADADYTAIDDANLDETAFDYVGAAYTSLDAENLLSEAEHSAWASDLIGSTNPWQVGVDPVCPEIHGSFPSTSVCCPIESENEAIATAVQTAQSTQKEVQSELQFAVRPPRLDAEFDPSDMDPSDMDPSGMDTSGMAPSGMSPVLAVNSDEPFEQNAYEFGNPWQGAPNVFPLNCRLGRQFSFGDNAPRMPKFGPPESVFSKEDILVKSRFSAELIRDPILNAESVDTPLSRSTFSSKDFLTTLHTSTYGSILLPVSKTHRTAVDYAMQLLSRPNSESRPSASHRLAIQLRSVGQSLVNFANQMEQQADEIDIARRENNQR